MTKEIVIASGEDWEGMYVDGNLVLQDHRLRVDLVLRALDFVPDYKTVDYNWLLDVMSLPDRIEDVKFED